MNLTIDHKFAVYKVQEVMDYIDALTGRDAVDAAIALEWFKTHRLDDAVVIRTQDVFAMSALYAYAHTIQTHLEMATVMFADGVELSDLTRDVLTRLRDIADYFIERASEAEARWNRGDVKVPD